MSNKLLRASRLFAMICISEPVRQVEGLALSQVYIYPLRCWHRGLRHQRTIHKAHRSEGRFLSIKDKRVIDIVSFLYFIKMFGKAVKTMKKHGWMQNFDVVLKCCDFFTSCLPRLFLGYDGGNLQYIYPTVLYELQNRTYTL
jgi:hypothetical protein